MSLDPRLAGLWRAAGRLYRILGDGGYYIVDPDRPYGISPDGSVLTFPDANPPPSYARIYGSGGIVGVWRAEFHEPEGIWAEERHYRENGTYTVQWTLDGVFDSELHGFYTVSGGLMTIEELRGRLSTTAPDAITMDLPYGPDQAGSYRVEMGGDRWVLVLAGVETSYDRVAAAPAGPAARVSAPAGGRSRPGRSTVHAGHTTKLVFVQGARRVFLNFAEGVRPALPEPGQQVLVEDAGNPAPLAGKVERIGIEYRRGTGLGVVYEIVLA